MRVRTHITRKERERLVLSDFKGVDFSSSPFRVSPSRATQMKNLINEYGTNHKRPGWREIRDLKPFGSEESFAVNGMFEYRHGGHEVVIVHAGRKLYRINAAGGISDDLTEYECISEGFTLTDERSQAFYSGGRLYMVGVGDYLVYGSWDEGESYELRRVYGDTDTYIPTTTISIDDDSHESDTARATLDQINLLTPYRKNKLLGAGLTVTDEEGVETVLSSRTWTLDAGYIDEGSDVKIALESLGEAGETVTTEISNSGSDKTLLYASDGTAVGLLDYVNGKITLTVDTTPPVEGMDNIVVTFSAGGGAEGSIGKCQFGIPFGTDGNTDRLFLSGNPELPNVDFYSEAENYTYFPDRNYCVVGSDASAIMGYVRLADSTLVIFKEEYVGEPSLYYRTGTTQIEYDSAGEISDVYGIFPVVAGAMGERLINRHTLANFGNDALMLSRNGVWGIVLGANSRTTESYTRERSRSINEKLRFNNLESACAVVYRNKYYLAADDVCYVADGRFTYRTSDNLDGAFNYEWWYWDNIPARVFSVIDDVLYFGTADGLICRFDERYTDRSYEVCEAGDLSYNTELSTVVYRSGIKVKENDRIKFTDPLYVNLQTECVVNAGCIGFTEGMREYIIDGMEVYAENVGESGLLREVKYLICDINRVEMTYRLSDADGAMLEIPDGASFDLCRNLQGKEIFITKVDEKAESELSLKEYKDSEALVLTEGEYNTIPQPRAIIGYESTVVAEWYSQIMDMGTNDQSKTLLKMTISCEPEMNGNITFGYETKAVSKMIDARGLRNMSVFSFDSLSFDEFTFECGYASSYSARVNARNFNFIIIRFISDGNADCAVNDITLTYKINRSNIGVR